MPVRPLSSELQKIAETELNEVPGRVEEDINRIREWLSQQPHIRARTDDQWLITFLRGCKFSLERTKEKIDLFYTMRTMLPEVFSNRDPFSPTVQDVLQRGPFIILPSTVYPAGPRILLVRCDVGDPEKVSVIDGVKVLTMIVDILLMEDDNYTVAGGTAIANLQAAPYGYVTHLSPDLIRRCAICAQDAYATRIKGIHAINTPSFVMAVYHTFKMLINEKNRNKIYFYNEHNVEDLYKIIPRSVLPKDFGGEAKSCAEIAADWKQKIESYRDWFLEDVQYKTDESKRPGKPKISVNTFGTVGSFRRMELD